VDGQFGRACVTGGRGGGLYVRDGTSVCGFTCILLYSEIFMAFCEGKRG
jgi:hypothetical protein